MTQIEPMSESLNFPSAQDGTKEAAAYAAIRARIVAGSIPSGGRLVIAELARELGMSDIPVRAALQRLAGQGLVDSKANAGYRVAAVDAKLVREAMAVLGSLWSLAGRLAAMNATPAEIDALDALHDAAGDALQRNDVVAYGRIGREFTFQLARASGNSYLARLTERVTLDSDRATAQLSQPHRMERTFRDAEVVLEAIRARRPDRAAAVRQWNMEDAESAYVQMLADQGLDVEH